MLKFLKRLFSRKSTLKTNNADYEYDHHVDTAVKRYHRCKDSKAELANLAEDICKREDVGFDIEKHLYLKKTVIESDGEAHEKMVRINAVVSEAIFTVLNRHFASFYPKIEAELDRIVSERQKAALQELDNMVNRVLDPRKKL